MPRYFMQKDGIVPEQFFSASPTPAPTTPP